jgi:hypothetical protein
MERYSNHGGFVPFTETFEDTINLPDRAQLQCEGARSLQA